MANFVQKLVSKKKRRFQEDGYDLDMTFITNQIVAMGFPSEGLEGAYRNKLTDVKKFFDTRHGGHYKIYNLCAERERVYDASKFHGRVANYPFDDHNAPPFVLIEPFCIDVQNYLAEDERNVAVVHCKAGKGRTGVMICAYLLHCKMWDNVKDALDFYGHARTKNGKGVTIASQLRYVRYYGKYFHEHLKYKPTTLIMKSIKLIGIPNLNGGTCVPQFTIRQGPEKVLICKSPTYDNISKDQKVACLNPDKPVPVCGDVKVEFIHKKSAGKEKMFHFWFNTFFIEDLRLVIPKAEIDKANKDKKHKVFPEKFTIEVIFESPDGLHDAMGILPVGGGGMAGAGAASEVRDSSVSQDTEWSDSDLTTDDDEEEEQAQAEKFEGLPISDV